MDTQVADAPMDLARDLRSAVASRNDALRQVLADYDLAETPDARWEAAAALMLAVEAVDAEYQQRKVSAVLRFRRRQRQARVA